MSGGDRLGVAESFLELGRQFVDAHGLALPPESVS
jgi:hypothetical protein